MRATCIFLLLSTLISTSDGQSVWIKATNNDGGSYFFDIISNQKISNPTSDQNLINYNTAISMERIDCPVLMENFHAPGTNIFTVYHPEVSGREGTIWALSGVTEDEVLLTPQRMADLVNDKFINFLDQDINQSKLNIYHHYKQGFNGNVLRLGGLPKNKDIPLQKYTGLLAEVIVFDHILPPQARQSLESSLALKYSIGLTEQFDYITPEGDIIWDHVKVSEYNNRIAGLARVDAHHLYQRQSSSQLEGGNLTIGLQALAKSNDTNHATIVPNAYLLWGDNNEELIFEERNGKAPTLRRKWRFQPHNFPEKTVLTFQLNHRGLSESLEEDHYYWLQIDSEEEYHRMTHQGDSFTTNPIQIKTSEASHFTFLKAPAFWGNLFIDLADCDSRESEKVKVNIVGGQPPYTIELHSTAETKVFHSNEPTLIMTGLKVDKYSIQLTDQHQNIWHSTFELMHEEIPDPLLQNQYILDSDYILLNAKVQTELPLSYQWLTPTGVLHDGSALQTAETGEYLVTIDNGRCSNTYSTEVISVGSNISFLEVTPNPAVQYFEVNATLKHPSDYNISIINAQGQPLHTRNGRRSTYIHEVFSMADAGVYFVRLESAQSVETKKVIIVE